LKVWLDLGMEVWTWTVGALIIAITLFIYLFKMLNQYIIKSKKFDKILINAEQRLKNANIIKIFLCVGTVLFIATLITKPIYTLIAIGATILSMILFFILVNWFD